MSESEKNIIEGWVAIYPTAGCRGLYPTKGACLKIPAKGLNGDEYAGRAVYVSEIHPVVADAIRTANRVLQFDLKKMIQFGPDYNQAVKDAADKIIQAMILTDNGGQDDANPLKELQRLGQEYDEGAS